MKQTKIFSCIQGSVLYAGVPVTGLLGAFIVRFQPQGMARAMYIMALAQAFVPVAALIIGTSDFAPGVVQVFGLNAVFVMLYIGSALLFQFAAERNNHPINLAAQPTIQDTGKERMTNLHDKQKMYALISGLIGTIGLVLMAVKIYSDSEPGAILLLVIIIVAGWYYISRSRFQQHEK